LSYREIKIQVWSDKVIVSDEGKQAVITWYEHLSQDEALGFLVDKLWEALKDILKKDRLSKGNGEAKG